MPLAEAQTSYAALLEEIRIKRAESERLRVAYEVVFDEVTALDDQLDAAEDLLVDEYLKTCLDPLDIRFTVTEIDNEYAVTLDPADGAELAADQIEDYTGYTNLTDIPLIYLIRYFSTLGIPSPYTGA